MTATGIALQFLLLIYTQKELVRDDSFQCWFTHNGKFMVWGKLVVFFYSSSAQRYFIQKGKSTI